MAIIVVVITLYLSTKLAEVSPVLTFKRESLELASDVLVFSSA